MEDITIDEYLIKTDRFYMETHEWVKDEGNGIWKMGISDYAQKMLHEISYIQFEDVNDEFSKGDVIVVVEALKATGDVYAPFDCILLENNETLDDDPEIISRSPYEDGYLVKIKAINEDKSKLISPEEYKKVIEKELEEL